MEIIDDRITEQSFNINIGDMIRTEKDDYLVILDDYRGLALLDICSLTVYGDGDRYEYHLEIVNSRDYLSRLLHEWLDEHLIEVISREQIQIVLKGDK